MGGRSAASPAGSEGEDATQHDSPMRDGSSTVGPESDLRGETQDEIDKVFLGRCTVRVLSGVLRSRYAAEGDEAAGVDPGGTPYQTYEIQVGVRMRDEKEHEREAQQEKDEQFAQHLKSSLSASEQEALGRVRSCFCAGADGAIALSVCTVLPGLRALELANCDCIKRPVSSVFYRPQWTVIQSLVHLRELALDNSPDILNHADACVVPEPYVLNWAIFDDLPMLRRLSLQGNRLKRICRMERAGRTSGGGGSSDGERPLPQLRSLALSRNRLKDLPHYVINRKCTADECCCHEMKGDDSALRDIWLRWNQFSSVPMCVTWLVCVRRREAGPRLMVDVGANSIISAPRGFLRTSADVADPNVSFRFERNPMRAPLDYLCRVHLTPARRHGEDSASSASKAVDADVPTLEALCSLALEGKYDTFTYCKEAERDLAGLDTYREGKIPKAGVIVLCDGCRRSMTMTSQIRVPQVIVTSRTPDYTPLTENVKKKERKEMIYKLKVQKRVQEAFVRSYDVFMEDRPGWRKKREAHASCPPHPRVVREHCRPCTHNDFHILYVALLSGQASIDIESLGIQFEASMHTLMTTWHSCSTRDGPSPVAHSGIVTDTQPPMSAHACSLACYVLIMARSVARLSHMYDSPYIMPHADIPFSDTHQFTQMPRRT